MENLSIEERQNDLWVKKNDNDYYAVVLMYRTSNSEVRWLTKGPMKNDSARKVLSEILNTIEQGRFVCVNSQFINPQNVISVKLDVWKEKESGRAYYE